jgi:hypothetical protein
MHIEDLVLLGLLLVGCGGAAITHPVDVRAIAAAEEARSCSYEAHAAARGVLSADVIESVEPWHEKVYGRTGAHDGPLIGARVYLRALSGMTPELLEKAMRCHCAERLLHPDQASVEPPRFPVCASDGWVDIDVGFDRRGYVVALRSRTAQQAETLLTRMTRFAQLHAATAR